jgi:hypothetical protein
MNTLVFEGTENTYGYVLARIAAPPQRRWYPGQYIFIPETRSRLDNSPSRFRFKGCSQ